MDCIFNCYRFSHMINVELKMKHQKSVYRKDKKCLNGGSKLKEYNILKLKKVLCVNYPWRKSHSHLSLLLSSFSVSLLVSSSVSPGRSWSPSPTLFDLQTPTHTWEKVTLCQLLFSAEWMWAMWWCRVTVAILRCRSNDFLTTKWNIRAHTLWLASILRSEEGRRKKKRHVKVLTITRPTHASLQT